MKFVYIADNIEEGFLGGAEQNDQELVNILKTRGHEVVKIKSDDPDILVKISKSDKLILSNFIFMFNRVKDVLSRGYSYIIYEHDHKYLLYRDPSCYQNYVAPNDELVNIPFYEKAEAVICQSKLHGQILSSNVPKATVRLASGNLWSEEILNYLEELSGLEKEDKYCIMKSAISHKNTFGCIRYCETSEIPYVVVGDLPHKEFVGEIAKYKTFFFMPQTVETLSRIVVEARMANCNVVTNQRVGASSEEWFSLKGKDLIDVMRGKREEIPEMIEEIFGD